MALGGLVFVQLSMKGQSSGMVMDSFPTNRSLFTPSLPPPPPFSSPNHCGLLQLSGVCNLRGKHVQQELLFLWLQCLLSPGPSSPPAAPRPGYGALHWTLKKSASWLLSVSCLSSGLSSICPLYVCLRMNIDPVQYKGRLTKTVRPVTSVWFSSFNISNL